MSAKPIVLPRWATDDVINATSLENNVVEPSEAVKDLGWDFKEKPPRQYFNWLGRKTYEWIKWLDDGDVNFNSLLINPDATGQTASAFANDSVIDKIGSGGYSVLSANTSIGSLFFGDTEDATAGGMRYNHALDRFSFITAGLSRGMFDENGNFVIGQITTVGKGKAHIFSGDSGTTGGLTNADDLVIEKDDYVGMSFLCPRSKGVSINFGNEVSSSEGGISYEPTISTVKINLSTGVDGNLNFSPDGIKIGGQGTIHCVAQNGQPISTTSGALWLDTDDGANGTLKILANGAYRNVAVL